MAQPVYVTKQILVAASSNGIGSISTAATPVVSVNSSQLDTQRRIIFTSTAADTSSLTLTFTGTHQGGGTVTESVRGSTAGAGSNATTLSDFLSVTSVAASSNANVPILIGTSSVAGTPWVYGNTWVTPPSYSAAIAISSSLATATWEFTLADPCNVYPYPSTAVTVPSVFASTGIAAAVGSSGASLGSSATLATGIHTGPITAWRVTLTSSSSTYLAVGTVLQAGVG